MIKYMPKSMMEFVTESHGDTIVQQGCGVGECKVY